MRRKLRRIPGLGGRGLHTALLSEPFHDRCRNTRRWSPCLSAPFDIRLYWTSFYRDQPFFGELDQWAAPASRTVVPDEFILRAARFLWRLGRRRGRVCLGPAERRPRLAALYSRSLGEHRPIWLVLGLRRALRLGDLSLRSMGFLSRCGLVLGSCHALGAGMGSLARIG